MGAVHGCHLKYVFVAVLSIVTILVLPPLSHPFPSSRNEAIEAYNDLKEDPFAFLCKYFLHFVKLYFLYSAFLNLYIAQLFLLRSSMGLLMKNKTTGQIPWLSYVLFSPFHVPTLLYTHAHHFLGSMSSSIPAASQIHPDIKLYVGSRYVEEVKAVTNWSGIIDLTCEFPETGKTQNYKAIPCWDGQPPSVEQLERGARFGRDAMEKAGLEGGSLMVHCAHGRGRSCLMMCAVLVRMGLVDGWEEGFDMVKAGRSCCKLNEGMRKRLGEWSEKFPPEGKKEGKKVM